MNSYIPMNAAGLLGGVLLLVCAYRFTRALVSDDLAEGKFFGIGFVVLLMAWGLYYRANQIFAPDEKTASTTDSREANSTTDKDDYEQLIGHEIRYLGPWELGVYESSKDCGAPTGNYLSFAVEFTPPRPGDARLVRITQNDVIRLLKEVDYTNCCGLNCIKRSALLASYQAPNSKKAISFLLPYHFLRKPYAEATQRITSYGPAATDKEAQQLILREETLLFDLASNPVPAPKSDLEEAIRRVEEGDPLVAIANLEYLASYGEGAISALPAVLSAMKSEHGGIWRAAVDTVHAIGVLNQEVTAGLSPYQTSMERNARHIEVLLDLGTKNNHEVAIQQALFGISRLPPMLKSQTLRTTAPFYASAMKSPNPAIRLVVVKGLARVASSPRIEDHLGSASLEAMVSLFEEARNDTVTEVKTHAEQALRVLEHFAAKKSKAAKSKQQSSELVQCRGVWQSRPCDEP